MTLGRVRAIALEGLAGTLLVGCARPPESAPPTRSFEERLAADLTWRPGDSRPSRRDVVRIEPAGPVRADVQPMLVSTEIRNRCGEAATFIVGPEDAIASPDAPVNVLAAGEAIEAFLTFDEWIHLRTASGEQRKAHGTGGWIVLTGEAACDAVTGIPK